MTKKRITPKRLVMFIVRRSLVELKPEHIKMLRILDIEDLEKVDQSEALAALDREVSAVVTEMAACFETPKGVSMREMAEALVLAGLDPERTKLEATASGTMVRITAARELATRSLSRRELSGRLEDVGFGRAVSGPMVWQYGPYGTRLPLRSTVLADLDGMELRLLGPEGNVMEARPMRPESWALIARDTADMQSWVIENYCSTDEPERCVGVTRYGTRCKHVGHVTTKGGLGRFCAWHARALDARRVPMFTPGVRELDERTSVELSEAIAEKLGALDRAVWPSAVRSVLRTMNLVRPTRC